MRNNKDLFKNSSNSGLSRGVFSERLIKKTPLRQPLVEAPSKYRSISDWNQSMPTGHRKSPSYSMQCFKLTPYEEPPTVNQALTYLKLRESGCSKDEAIKFSSKKRCCVDTTQKLDGPSNRRIIKRIDNKEEGIVRNGWQFHQPEYAFGPSHKVYKANESFEDYNFISEQYKMFENKYRIEFGQIVEKNESSAFPNHIKISPRNIPSKEELQTEQDDSNQDLDAFKDFEDAEEDSQIDYDKVMNLDRREVTESKDNIQIAKPSRRINTKPPHIKRKSKEKTLPKLEMKRPAVLDQIDKVYNGTYSTIVIRSIRPMKHLDLDISPTSSNKLSTKKLTLHNIVTEGQNFGSSFQLNKKSNELELGRRTSGRRYKTYKFNSEKRFKL